MSDPDELAALLTTLDDRLETVDATLAVAHGSPAPPRQPVHTVYMAADRFTAGLPARWGETALGLIDEHAPDAARLATAVGRPAAEVADVLPRVRTKLAVEPIEDLRVDFEDGYGYRPDDDEDVHAKSAGAAIGSLLGASGAPFVAGIRIKSMEARDRPRGVRTLNLVLDALRDRVGDDGTLPARFVVTLPKVSDPAQVEAMVTVAEALEASHGLVSGALGIEVQIELPAAVQGPDGIATVARLVAAAGGRCAGVHYGTYDYSAAMGVAAGLQSLEHPVADHAKAVMQLAAVGAGVPAVDGSTNVVPAGDVAAVHAAWNLHARLVSRSLDRAFYQGWDLHPGHLVTRYLATYTFFRAALPTAGARLRAYVGRSASGGGVVDEPATARALSAVILRGLDCGAISPDEVASAAVEVAQLRRLARPRG